MSELQKLDDVREKPILSTTQAFQILVQASADITDDRARYEEHGLVSRWMTYDEAIACVLTLMVKDSYETHYSPQMMASLLTTYCPDDLADAFISFYCQVMAQSGTELTEATLRNGLIEPVIHIRDFAAHGRGLGWKASWGVFKEPYQSYWHAGFAS